MKGKVFDRISIGKVRMKGISDQKHLDFLNNYFVVKDY